MKKLDRAILCELSSWQIGIEDLHNHLSVDFWFLSFRLYSRLRYLMEQDFVSAGREVGTKKLFFDITPLGYAALREELDK